MADTTRALEQLTTTHVVHHDGAEYERAALVKQLRDAISSSTGTGSGRGGGPSGSLLNLAAFELWELIDGITRGWLREWGQDHTGELTEALQRLHRTIQAQHALGEIDDDFRERLEAAFGKWVWEIGDLFDPPHQKELTAACPECSERHYLIKEKDAAGRIIDTRQAAAIIIPVKPGRALVAECRCCGAMWATEAELVRLAQGMRIDVDTVALRDLTQTPPLVVLEV